MKQGNVFICDSCGVEAFGQLQMSFWYGSKFDMSQGNLHLCDECWEKVKRMLEKDFDVDLKLNEITEL